MCRFALYAGPPVRLASLVTEPEHSIIRQSFHSHEGIDSHHADGYGVAWYVPRLQPEPVVFRELTPAWNSLNLHSLARGVESGMVLAHVRAATGGLAVSQLNCHPFARGALAFMHNGEIGGFRRLHRALRRRLSDGSYEAIQGTTDSEHLFAWFVDHYEDCGIEDPLERLAAALSATFRDLDALRHETGVLEPCRLNVAVTDGRCAAVSRCNLGEDRFVNSLYVRRGRYRCEDGVPHVQPATNGDACVLVASEPLFNGGAWERVPEGHVVLVDEQRAVQVRALETHAAGRSSAP